MSNFRFLTSALHTFPKYNVQLNLEWNISGKHTFSFCPSENVTAMIKDNGDAFQRKYIELRESEGITINDKSLQSAKSRFGKQCIDHSLIAILYGYYMNKCNFNILLCNDVITFIQQINHCDMNKCVYIIT